MKIATAIGPLLFLYSSILFPVEILLLQAAQKDLRGKARAQNGVLE
jgi:hypothetical protein